MTPEVTIKNLMLQVALLRKMWKTQTEDAQKKKIAQDAGASTTPPGGSGVATDPVFSVSRRVAIA